MITVGATSLALFPLAVYGGPLWQPLCYPRRGGPGLATFISVSLVRVLYAVFVLDLKSFDGAVPLPVPKALRPI
jgi:hypothetical protein